MENRYKFRRKAIKALTAAMDLQTMLEAYLEAALWSSTDADGNPLDKKYDYSAWSIDAHASAKADCAEFIEKAGDALDDARPQQVGHDFWLTRNGHGAGFWEREDYYAGHAQFLTALAHDFPEVTVVVGPRGLLDFQ